jgi:hypothetical protein
LTERDDALIREIHCSWWHLVPEPAGRISSALYWMRVAVDDWAAEHPERVKRERHDNRPANAGPTEPEKSKTSR